MMGRTLALLLASLAFLPTAASAQGGSAVITLVMPVGARQLGMGEAAVAVADDVFATFWNPAGIAFGPVSNEWEMVLPASHKKSGVEMRRAFTALAAKPRSGLLLKSIVWAGAEDALLLYNGKHWRDYHEVVLEQGDQIDKIVRRYVGSGDNLDSLIKQVKAYNKIADSDDEANLISLRLPYNLLFKDEAVTSLVLDNTDRLWVGTTGGLYRFDGSGWKSFHQESGFTYLPADSAALLANQAAAPVAGPALVLPDTAAAVMAANRARDTAKTAADSVRAKDLARIADSLKAYAKHASDSALIANQAADSAAKVAQKAAVAEGQGTIRKLGVTALAVKGVSIWIGTTDGLYEYKKTSILRRGQTLLPSQHVTGIASHESLDEIYVSVKDAGIARYTPPKSSGSSAKWKLYSPADGLLDSSVGDLVLDKFGHVWAAHAGGVSHFNLRSWEKIHFKKQEVRSLGLDEEDNVWIGTNEGAWKHSPNYAHAKGRSLDKKKGPEEGGKMESKGGWVHFHSGNGLADKRVRAIRSQGADIWFLTEAGIERYNSAKSQVGFFYESLLPVLNLPDLYHAFLGTTFPVEEWGTVGGFINYVSFGQNTQTSQEGVDGPSFDSYELVGALSYGTRLSKNIGLGLNAKFIYSALAKGITSSGEETDGIAASYAVDAGVLWKNVGLRGLSLAMVLQNMGPAVFYVDQAQADPIPFTWKFGMAYDLLHTPSHRLTVAADANREAVYREGNEASPVYIGAWKDLVYPFDDKDHTAAEVWQENIYQTVFNSGMEYVYANVAAFRAGYLYDESGKRYELDVGLGFMLSDILQVDGTFIKSFDNGIRNGQKRFSMVLRF